MKIGFPNKILGICAGWEDRGEVGKKLILPEAKLYSSQVHDYCKSVLHIGTDKNGFFKFCPLCMVKIIEEKK